MKKIVSLCCLALLVTLSGCKDAQAGLSDGKEALITVGKTTITKNEVFDSLKSQNGITSIISKATAFIVDKEVPVTDEMMKEASETTNEFKLTLGEDKWDSFLTAMGYDNEQQYIEERALLAVRAARLSTKYIEDNYDAVKETYQVRKVQIFQTSDSKVAGDVQAKVKSGELTIEEAVSQYEGVTTTYNGKDQIVTNATGLPSSAWESIMKVTEDNTLLDTYQWTSDLKTFYVIKVVQVDVPLEDALSTIENISSISDDAFAFYLDKYGFRVYDIDIYNGIKAQAPSYLVQDK